MENGLLGLIVKNIETLKKDTDKKFDKLEGRIEDIDGKIDELLKFKWQIIGGSVMISLIFSIGIQILTNKIGG